MHYDNHNRPTRDFFYILPDGQPLSKCPVENCYSLDGAFAFFFTSDTTVALVEGTHVYSNFNDEDDVLIFELVYNFMLTAMNNNLGATIKCNGSVGFKFMYVRNLIINGIKFEECGANVLQISNYVVSATLHIVISCNVVIKNVTVAKGRGFGLLVYNPHGRFQLQNSNFFENQLNFGIFKLPLHTHFTCSSQRAFMIEKSSFINGRSRLDRSVELLYKRCNSIPVA